MLVRVHAKREGGFRRAGRFWPASPTVIDLDEATIALLQAEPMLDVRPAREGDVPAPSAPARGDSVESLREEIARNQDAMAQARAVAEAEALRANDLQAQLRAAEDLATEEAQAHDGTRDKLAKTEKALASAQEACSKLREELKALRSKKSDKPEEPSPAPATPAQG